MLHGLESADSKSVHQARVASRRLRELLPVLQLESHTAVKLGRRLRGITQTLGPVREADVLLTLIAELEDRHEGTDSAALAQVAAHVRSRRHRAAERATNKATIGEYRRLSKKLERAARFVEEGQTGTHPGRGWQWALEARVARRAAALAASMKSAGAVYLPERLHAVRIALKKLRYAVELNEQAAARKRSPERRRLKRVQDMLGRLHDLQVLLDHVRQAHATAPNPDVTSRRQFDRLVRHLEDDCRRIHARYMRERPKLEALCQRLSVGTPAAVRRAG